MIIAELKMEINKIDKLAKIGYILNVGTN